MWELDYKESWAPKNDAFELCCWRRLLRVPWTARRSNQSRLKEISPEYLLEGLKLKLQSFTWCKEPTHWKRSSCWERSRAGGEGDDGRWLDSITDSTYEFEQVPGDGEGRGSLGCYSAWGPAVHGVPQSVGSRRVGRDWEGWTTSVTIVVLVVFILCAPLFCQG